MSIYEFLIYLRTKNIFIYGTGLFGISLNQLFPNRASYFIDDDVKKHNQLIDGIPVGGIDILREYNKCFIIVTVNYDSIKHKLECLGLFEDVHFCNAANLCYPIGNSEEKIDRKGFFLCAFDEFRRSYLRYCFKLESPWEALLRWIGMCINDDVNFFIRRYKMLRDRKIMKYFYGEYFCFRDIFLPDIRYEPRFINEFITVYEDVLHLYTCFGDNYNREMLEQYNDLVTEGTYCYITSDGIRIDVEQGDIVIDGGAWIGDFSAYAARKGAMVYAFEPSPEVCYYLKQTAQVNGNIEVVSYGLSDSMKTMALAKHSTTSAGDKLVVGLLGEDVETLTLDYFCQLRSIERIDFIKADIEGFERLMLKGAREVLKRFGPKLAICTYHLPDDPYVLRELILDANPKYEVYQTKAKLFAHIPDK